MRNRKQPMLPLLAIGLLVAIVQPGPTWAWLGEDELNQLAWPKDAAYDQTKMGATATTTTTNQPQLPTNRLAASGPTGPKASTSARQLGALESMLSDRIKALNFGRQAKREEEAAADAGAAAAAAATADLDGKQALKAQVLDGANKSRASSSSSRLVGSAGELAKARNLHYHTQAYPAHLGGGGGGYHSNPAYLLQPQAAAAAAAYPQANSNYPLDRYAPLMGPAVSPADRYGPSSLYNQRPQQLYGAASLGPKQDLYELTDTRGGLYRSTRPGGGYPNGYGSVGSAGGGYNAGYNNNNRYSPADYARLVVQYIQQNKYSGSGQQQQQQPSSTSSSSSASASGSGQSSPTATTTTEANNDDDDDDDEDDDQDDADQQANGSGGDPAETSTTSSNDDRDDEDEDENEDPSDPGQGPALQSLGSLSPGGSTGGQASDPIASTLSSVGNSGGSDTDPNDDTNDDDAEDEDPTSGTSSGGGDLGESLSELLSNVPIVNRLQGAGESARGKQTPVLLEKAKQLATKVAGKEGPAREGPGGGKGGAGAAKKAKEPTLRADKLRPDPIGAKKVKELAAKPGRTSTIPVGEDLAKSRKKPVKPLPLPPPPPPVPATPKVEPKKSVVKPPPPVKPAKGRWPIADRLKELPSGQPNVVAPVVPPPPPAAPIPIPVPAPVPVPAPTPTPELEENDGQQLASPLAAPEEEEEAPAGGSEGAIVGQDQVARQAEVAEQSPVSADPEDGAGDDDDDSGNQVANQEASQAASQGQPDLQGAPSEDDAKLASPAAEQQQQQPTLEGNPAAEPEVKATQTSSTPATPPGPKEAVESALPASPAAPAAASAAPEAIAAATKAASEQLAPPLPPPPPPQPQPTIQLGSSPLNGKLDLGPKPLASSGSFDPMVQPTSLAKQAGPPTGPSGSRASSSSSSSSGGNPIAAVGQTLVGLAQRNQDIAKANSKFLGGTLNTVGQIVPGADQPLGMVSNTVGRLPQNLADTVNEPIKALGKGMMQLGSGRSLGAAGLGGQFNRATIAANGQLKQAEAVGKATTTTSTTTAAAKS